MLRGGSGRRLAPPTQSSRSGDADFLSCSATTRMLCNASSSGFLGTVRVYPTGGETEPCYSIVIPSKASSSVSSATSVLLASREGAS